jgi:quercetin dioxygenase-like cupin family protein
VFSDRRPGRDAIWTEAFEGARRRRQGARVEYTPRQGDRTPVHSHPATVVYVIKGGKVRFTMQDGFTRDVELKSGDALLRPPVTHTDEALEDVEVILVEIKE